MNLVFESHGTGRYLSCRFICGDADMLSLNMITRNHISGLLPACFTKLNKEGTIRYDISSKVSLQSVLSGSIEGKQLLRCFRSIASAISAAEEYMILPDFLVLDPEYIFVDTDRYEAGLVCLPVFDSRISCMSPVTLFKQIVFSAKYDDGENLTYVTRLIAFLNNEPEFTLAGFKHLLDGLMRDEDGRLPAVHETGYAENREHRDVSEGGYSDIIADSAGVNHGIYSEVKQKAKKMSLIYLMLHYNRENEEVYRSQRIKKSKNTYIPAVPALPEFNKYPDNNL